MNDSVKKFAFIDFHNTDGTTKKLHGFYIDWIKLYEFLKKDWNCEKVFCYIEKGQKEKAA